MCSTGDAQRTTSSTARAVCTAGIALPQCPLLRELGEGEQAVRDRVARGLVARADQQDEERRA